METTNQLYEKLRDLLTDQETFDKDMAEIEKQGLQGEFLNEFVIRMKKLYKENNIKIEDEND